MVFKIWTWNHHNHSHNLSLQGPVTIHDPLLKIPCQNYEPCCYGWNFMSLSTNFEYNNWVLWHGKDGYSCRSQTFNFFMLRTCFTTELSRLMVGMQIVQQLSSLTKPCRKCFLHPPSTVENHSFLHSNQTILRNTNKKKIITDFNDNLEPKLTRNENIMQF